MASKADVVCLQETRLTAAGERAMTALAKKNGEAGTVGCPIGPQR